MIDTASESERFCPENRGGRRRAGFALVGIVAALGFCANATPALASDGVEPPPLVPEFGVSEEIPPLPQLDVDETAVVPVPEEPPIVIDTSLEGDDVDVSIRVLSPGENALEAPVDATSDVISETLEPDITADPVLPDTLPTPTVPIEQEAVNTNISIRVLSPGRNGVVDQVSGLATGGPAEPSPDEAPFEDVETASEAEDAPEIAGEQPQYHDDNTRYQSDDISEEDPWVWEWYLSLDCSGNVTSISSEIGSPSSRDWAWNWIWDWTCGLDGASEESGDALQEGFASIASVDSPGGPAGAAGGTSATPGQQPDPSGERWHWTWTFNFCGRETTFSIQAGAQTSLAWTWDWTWAWACTSAEVVSPTPGEEGYGEGPSGPAADPGTPAGELELPPPLEIVAEPFFASTLFTAPPTVGPFVIAAPISIAPAIPIARTLPTGSGLEPAPASGPGRARAPAPVPVLTPAQVPVATAPTGIHTATATPISSEDHRARPASSRDREASPRPARRLPQLPLGPARRAAGSSTSSGGAAPGGGAASGIAALTGFYVLAAPGLGRRLRVVRELSPRARSEAPLDRPG